MPARNQPARTPLRGPITSRLAAVAPNDNLSGYLNRYVPEALRGSDRFLDLINWNIRWFNPRDATRLKRITQVFTELNADILVCQEIEAGALDPVADRLNATGAGFYKTAYGTTGGDQRVALVYDTEWVRAKEDITELFHDEPPYVGKTRKRIFPRLPLHSTLVGKADDGAFDFHLVGLHLKSQRANDGDDGTEQRRLSATRLTQWLTRDLGDEPDVILLGDWNAKPDEPEWQPVRAAEAAGKLRFLAWNKDNEASHFFQNGAGSRLDLVVVSDDAEKVAVDQGARVIPWNDAFASLTKLRGYIDTLSDHLPVVSRFYFTDATGD